MYDAIVKHQSTIIIIIIIIIIINIMERMQEDTMAAAKNLLRQDVKNHLAKQMEAFFL